MDDLQAPLPCIICGVRPESVNDDGHGPQWQPHAATVFTAGPGHYGSTVWDEPSSDRALWITVCDRCLLQHRERAAVVTTTRDQPPARQFDRWNPYGQQ